MAIPYISNAALYEIDNLVHNQPEIDRFLKMASHEQINPDYETRLPEDRRSVVTIPDQYKGHTEKSLQLLFEFADMWDGHLAGIKTTRHRIELRSNDVHQVDGHQYRAGPIARELAVKEVQKMLKEDVSEPANIK